MEEEKHEFVEEIQRRKKHFDLLFSSMQPSAARLSHIQNSQSQTRHDCQNQDRDRSTSLEQKIDEQSPCWAPRTNPLLAITHELNWSPQNR